MAPPKSRSFSVSVVLPASGCEMIAKVRRRLTGAEDSVMACFRFGSERLRPQGRTPQYRLLSRPVFSDHIGVSRQQPKGGDPVSHCHTPWSPVSPTWILASAEVRA